MLLALVLLAGLQSPETHVDRLFDRYLKSPGAAVAVVLDGKPVLLKGYGLADVATSRPIDPDTTFDLASVSKQFTAASVLILAQRGRLSLDDPLTKFFPTFPAWGKKVTVRHLLNHTSGLPDYMEMFVKSGKLKFSAPRPSSTPPDVYEPQGKDVVTLLATADGPEFEPGAKFEYSNSGYAVLAQIAEKASGQRLAEFMRANIFRPLGMSSTLLMDERKRKPKDRAKSYLFPAASKDADYTPLNLVYGDGNVNSSARDMAAWAVALQNGKWMSEPWRTMAWTPGKLQDGSLGEYGFGWVLGRAGDEPFVDHSGGWVGFRSYIMHVPKRKLTVVVLSNLGTMKAVEQGRKVAEIYLAAK
ncbi:MAG TPA: serine hydrolase domain-containing protein [Fimbriimonadaceae bacterium]|nr:serine hydrolase domain-containing protein [Fimbriimonadaceae bacterium]